MDLVSKIEKWLLCKLSGQSKLRRRMEKRGREGARLTDAHTNFE